MPIISPRHMLSELRVRESMRRIAVSIQAETTIEHAIRCAVKNKISAILVTNKQLEPIGVVSKTDIMGAYYAGIPLSAPAGLIMNSPPICCAPEDSLDKALNIMREKGIHRVYVSDESLAGIGIISYHDVVGLLYRYCRRCERNVRRKLDATCLLRVRDVMTSFVRIADEHDALTCIMEMLSAHNFGALLIGNALGPAGVVSKTDLILAYKHGLPGSERAGSVMRVPVRSCCQDEELEKVIRQMIFWDIRRFFVFRDSPGDIIGVLSLTDAAQARSGSCRACMPTRIEVL